MVICLKIIIIVEKICYVPRWNNNEMEMVKLNSYQDYLSLPVNRWNIPEPNHDEIRDIGNTKMNSLSFFLIQLFFFILM